VPPPPPGSNLHRRPGVKPPPPPRGWWDLRPEGFVGEFPFFLFGDLRRERSVVFVVTESTFFILFGAFMV
jgi:hypothetical protein